MNDAVAPRKCPQCGNGILVEGRDILDQSGQTHLTTKTLKCMSLTGEEGCGYLHWEPAVDATWETNPVHDPLTGKALTRPRGFNLSPENTQHFPDKKVKVRP